MLKLKDCSCSFHACLTLYHAPLCSLRSVPSPTSLGITLFLPSCYTCLRYFLPLLFFSLSSPFCVCVFVILRTHSTTNFRPHLSSNLYLCLYTQFNLMSTIANLDLHSFVNISFPPCLVSPSSNAISKKFLKVLLFRVGMELKGLPSMCEM